MTMYLRNTRPETAAACKTAGKSNHSGTFRAPPPKLTRAISEHCLAKQNKHQTAFEREKAATIARASVRRAHTQQHNSCPTLACHRIETYSAENTRNTESPRAPPPSCRVPGMQKREQPRNIGVNIIPPPPCHARSEAMICPSCRHPRRSRAPPCPSPCPSPPYPSPSSGTRRPCRRRCSFPRL